MSKQRPVEKKKGNFSTKEAGSLLNSQTWFSPTERMRHQNEKDQRILQGVPGTNKNEA